MQDAAEDGGGNNPLESTTMPPSATPAAAAISVSTEISTLTTAVSNMEWLTYDGGHIPEAN